MTQTASGTWNIGARLGLSDSDAQLLYFLGSLVLTVALVIVTAYYAWQNRQMVGEIRRQNRPYVFATVVKNPGQDPITQATIAASLVVRNTGNRVAMKVQMKVIREAFIWQQVAEISGVPLRLIDDRAPVSTMRICGDGVSSLPPCEEHQVGYVPQNAHEHPDCGPQQLEYEIAYEDGAQTTYKERLSVRYLA